MRLEETSVEVESSCKASATEMVLGSLKKQLRASFPISPITGQQPKMISVDYRYIEQLLVRLLSLLTNRLAEAEIGVIQEFIDVGEYGLALDILVDILSEESMEISHDVLSLVKQSAVAMQMDDTAIEIRLGGLVSGVKE